MAFTFFIFGATDSLPVIAGATTLVDIITDFRGVNQGGTDRIDLTSIVSVVFQVTNVPGQGQLLEFAANNGTGPLNQVFLPGIGPLSNADFDI